MSKYIIKNCPAIYGIDDGFLCSYREDEEDEKYCYDCTDCKLKQIVELCKNKDYFVKRFLNAEFSSGVQNSELAFDILKLLDIQGVE